MSGGDACACSERKKPISNRDWEVWQYRCNHSAFNGYHYTISDYSSVCCNACGKFWRTKAGYVEKLLALGKRKLLNKEG